MDVVLLALRAPFGACLGSVAAVALAMAVGFRPAAALTLDEAIGSGLAHNPSADDLQARVEGALAARLAARGHYGPKLRVEGSVIAWDEEQVLDLTGGGEEAAQLPPPSTPYEEAFAGMLASLGKPTTLRDQVTSSLSLQLVQPVLGLWTIHQAHALAAIGVDVAEVQRQAGHRHLVATIVETYYRVLQAEAMQRAADEAVSSLGAKREKVLAFERGGLADHADVLKIDVALSAMRQQAIAAAQGASTARAGLARAMGAPTTDLGALEIPAPGWAAEDPPPLADARAKAAAGRPELAEIERRIEQAEAGVGLAKARMLPDLNLIAKYEHTTGSSLADPNSAFVGAMLSWTAFEWGATWYQSDQAQAGLAQARAGLAQARAGISFEVESAWLAHDTARRALEVGTRALLQAKESVRLEQARFEASATTTADLLDAETALAQARLGLEAARYDRIIALARLRHATGASLSGESP